MLLRFRVSNYASLRDEQELSLVALDEHPELAVNPVPLSKERALPVVGLFGPNASGKSNVIKAARFARDAITESHQYWLPEEPIPRWPFRLDDGSRAQPSVFAFDFVLGGIRYEYGFSLDDFKIHQEWLYSWPRGKRQRLFERAGGDKPEFGTNLTGPKAAIADLVRENSLFLSAAAANNHPQLRAIAAWFGNWRSVRPNSALPQAPAPWAAPDDRMIELIKFADVGIVGSVIVERSQEEWELTLGRSRRVRRMSRQGLAVDDGRAGTRSSDDESQRPVSRLEFMHRAATGSGQEPLPWHWESSGTQSWLRIAGSAARALNDGGVLIVDDLGSDLHPLLTAQLVGLFQSLDTNRHGAQLIFTGHDVSLLGKHVEQRLRRDEVWLVSKNDVGATTIYPLTEYGRVRDGLDDVEGRYLQGRYGAVPFFDQQLLDTLRADPVE